MTAKKEVRTVGRPKKVPTLTEREADKRAMAQAIEAKRALILERAEQLQKELDWLIQRVKQVDELERNYSQCYLTQSEALRSLFII